VFGFKCFLLHSGVDEFPPLDPEGLELALKEIASFGAMMSDETDKWAKVVQFAGIKVE